MMRIHIVRVLSTAGALLVLACAPGCTRSEADEAPTVADTAAHYKEGHGVQLGADAAAFVGLRTAEVEARAFRGGSEGAAIPREALLRTVRGTYVYVENGEWLLRSPVRPGAEEDGWIEIVDGLYEGDRVVVAGVDALWMAEISAVNGGVGCADGH